MKNRRFSLKSSFGYPWFRCWELWGMPLGSFLSESARNVSLPDACPEMMGQEIRSSPVGVVRIVC